MSINIDNEKFLNSIFGDKYIYAHVTSFIDDPNNIPVGQSGRCWAGGAYKDIHLLQNSNQFYTVSLFVPDEAGRSRRRKANFSGCYVIGLDDVREKLPIEQVKRLPLPSIVIKSSLYSEQWLYLLATPCTDISQIDNLHDGLIKNGLAPNSKDPGQKGVTRYLRLPEGCNTKAKRIKENNGIPPRSEITEWHPERRYTLAQLATPFNVDLNAPRRESRVDGAADVSDHPLLHTDALHIKEVRSDGRFDITCPWIDGHTDGDDSGSAIFTNADGSIGFKCHHGSCDSRTAADLLKVIEVTDSGFNERLKQWQMVREFKDVATEVSPPVNNAISMSSALNRLRSFSAKGDSQKMKMKMLDDKFILKDLAILGQITVLYAGPNTGKTLLTLWMLCEAIKNNVLKGEDVFYTNLDDTYKGGVEKLEISEKYNFEMILPNAKEFKAETLIPLMQEMADQGEASGKVVILDTLKKFTDLMDKRVSSEFSKVARSFAAAGGSIIALAHVNKHKGVEGKSVYAGTSDIRDDSDCVYTIEKMNESMDTHTIQFECTKSRGDVAQKMSFQYTKKKGAGYQGLFDSVKRITNDVVESVQHAAQQEDERKKDADAIEKIKCAITNGQDTKTLIESFVVSSSDVSHRRTRDVLKKYEGRLWTVEKGLHNKSIYKLIELPIVPQVSFF